MLKDYLGAAVSVGDLVLDDRGVVYMVVDEAGLAAEGCAKGRIMVGRPDSPEGLVETIRVRMMFLMGLSVLGMDEHDRASRWHALYMEHVESRVTATIRGRQHTIDENAKRQGWRGGFA